MSERLVIDQEIIDSCINDGQSAISMLTSSSLFTESMAKAAGPNGPLQDVLADTESDWKLRRTAMIDILENQVQSIRDINQSFTQADVCAAKSLRSGLSDDSPNPKGKDPSPKQAPAPGGQAPSGSAPGGSLPPQEGLDSLPTDIPPEGLPSSTPGESAIPPPVDSGESPSVARDSDLSMFPAESRGQISAFIDRWVELTGLSRNEILTLLVVGGGIGVGVLPTPGPGSSDPKAPGEPGVDADPHPGESPDPGAPDSGDDQSSPGVDGNTDGANQDSDTTRPPDDESPGHEDAPTNDRGDSPDAGGDPGPDADTEGPPVSEDSPALPNDPPESIREDRTGKDTSVSSTPADVSDADRPREPINGDLKLANQDSGLKPLDLPDLSTDIESTGGAGGGTGGGGGGSGGSGLDLPPLEEAPTTAESSSSQAQSTSFPDLSSSPSTTSTESLSGSELPDLTRPDQDAGQSSSSSFMPMGAMGGMRGGVGGGASTGSSTSTGRSLPDLKETKEKTRQPAEQAGIGIKDEPVDNGETS